VTRGTAALLVMGILGVPPGFAGVYDTEVTLVQNGCGAVTVENRTTTIEHRPGDSSFALVHAGLSYAGTVAADSTFHTSVTTVDGGDARYAIAIAGRFTRTGFRALVTVDRHPTSGSACRYVVRWLGVRRPGPG
jgi:hypothetical protein